MFGSMKWLEQQSRASVAIVAVLMVLGVGFMDYATNPEISFSAFYLVGVGFAAWYVGQQFAYFIAIFSVAVSLVGDIAGGSHYSSLLVPFWNESIVLAFYLVVITLLTRLHSLTKGLEVRVMERTAALTTEMNKREHLERELIEVSEREQRRIGHDLHDSLGQHLTGTALAAQVLEEKLKSQGRREASDANKVVELVEMGIALSRKLARGLHPIEMEAEGLMQALEELATTSSDLFKVTCRFECDMPILVHDAATSGHMYRIAQEAISNAVKHGKATNVIIQLETLVEGIALRVKDDGLGLPHPLPKNAGMGLRIMAHRAGMIGASFSARHEESGGTTISCVLRQEQAKVPT